MFALKVIGCAPGMPRPDLANSAFLVSTERDGILLDAGEGLSSALQRCKIDARSIGAVIISHMHPDHCMGLPLFVQTNYLLKRTRPLAIHAPSEAVEGIKRLFELTYLFSHKLGFDLALQGIEEGVVVVVDNVRIKAHGNRHLKGHAGFLSSSGLSNRMQSFSFSLECEGKKLVYSGDLAGLDDIIPIVNAADLLVVDGMHVDLTQLPEIASRAGVKRVLLTHLPEGFDAVAVQLAHGRNSAIGELIFAAEGLEVAL